MRIYNKGNTLIVDFGKPVKWIGLSLHEVRVLRTRLEQAEEELGAMES